MGSGAVLNLAVEGDGAKPPVPVTSCLSPEDFCWLEKEFARLKLRCAERTVTYAATLAATPDPKVRPPRRTRMRHHRQRFQTVRCQSAAGRQ